MHTMPTTKTQKTMARMRRLHLQRRRRGGGGGEEVRRRRRRR